MNNCIASYMCPQLPGRESSSDSDTKSGANKPRFWAQHWNPVSTALSEAGSAITIFHWMPLLLSIPSFGYMVYGALPNLEIVASLSWSYVLEQYPPVTEPAGWVTTRSSSQRSPIYSMLNIYETKPGPGWDIPKRHWLGGPVMSHLLSPRSFCRFIISE